MNEYDEWMNIIWMNEKINKIYEFYECLWIIMNNNQLDDIMADKNLS